MATVMVKLYGLWRRHLGISILQVEANDINEVLAELDEKLRLHLENSPIEARLKMEGQIKDNSVVLLNGIGLRNLKETTLKEGDVLFVFPPIGGG